MRTGSVFAVCAAFVASVLLTVAPPSHAATLNFTDAGCADFSIASSGNGTFQVTCNFVAVPVCQLNTTNANPAVGSTITLTAACSSNPFGWLFTGTAAPCSTTQSTCTESRSTAGPVTYTVLGGNGAGRGPIASVTVNWQGATAAQAPNCQIPTVSPSNVSSSGGPITLNVACTASSAITYTWTRTAPSAATLSSGSSSSGTSDTVAANTGLSNVSYSYSVQACTSACVTNSVTFSVPAAGGTPTPTGFCAQYSDVVFVTIPWKGFVNSTGFKAGGVLVGSFTVPAGAVYTFGSSGIVTGTEFGDSPVDRTATLSTQPCDFGQGGPGVTLKTFYGQQPNQLFTVTGTAFGQPQLVAGSTYYFNVRNFSQDLQRISCNTFTCNMQLSTNSPN